MIPLEDEVVDNWRNGHGTSDRTLAARQVQELKKIREVLERIRSKMGGLSGETGPG